MKSPVAKLIAVAATFALSIGTAPTVLATPIQWLAADGGNGNFYEYVEIPGISWTDALAAAGASELMGAVGHLATITSAAENDFIEALLPIILEGRTEQVRLGGFQTSSAGGSGDNWIWVTGEAWSYTNWGGTNPNGGATVTTLTMWSMDRGAHVRGSWNDEIEEQPLVVGYMVEFAAAEPGPPLLISLGTAFFLMMRRRSVKPLPRRC